jgi:hypothetical protein
MAEESEEFMMGLRAMLMAHGAVLFALVATHPDKPGLHQVLGQMMSEALASVDPRSAGLIRAFQDQVNQALQI